jgi:hypothetical protein
VLRCQHQRGPAPNVVPILVGPPPPATATPPSPRGSRATLDSQTCRATKQAT